MCTVLLSRTSTSGYSAVNYSMRHISEVSCVCVSQTYLSKEQFRVQNTQEERKRDPESNTAKWSKYNWFSCRNNDACNPELYVWLLRFTPFLSELCQTQQSRQLLSPCFLSVTCINILAGRLRSLVECTVQNGAIPQGVNNNSVCEHSTPHLETTATNAVVRFPTTLYLPAEVM